MTRINLAAKLSLNSKAQRVYLFIFLFISGTNISTAQCDYDRYREFVFDDVEVNNNVSYGGADSWFFPFSNVNLEMDIYQPEGDLIELRPAIIWCHSGGFITGDKGVDDMVALCENYAKLGYVAVSINYRQGFNLLSNDSGVRAVYRGVQDTRAAYRFMVENADILKIDPNKIFIGGSSAGGFCALQTAYLDDDERPGTTFDFPNLGCLDCSGNNFDHPVEPLGIINLWGAIGDTTWIDTDEDVNIYMAHGTDDGTVPYDVGPPFGVFLFDDVFGSLPISERLDHQGLVYDFTTVVGGEHEPHGTDNGTWNDPPTPFWDQMNTEIIDFTLTKIIPESPNLEATYQVCLGEVLNFESTNPEWEWCYSGDGISTISGNSLELLFDTPGVYTGQAFYQNNIYAVSEPRLINFEVVGSGCTDTMACNFDPAALCDDDSCEFTSCICPGDVNFDGMVNILDLVVISSNFGCSEDCSGDADLNGSVDILDTVLVSSNFGIICE